MRDPRAKVLLLATADWDRPLWTNKQYMATELSREFEVLYVNSLGLRRPSFSKEDIQRSLARGKRLLPQPKKKPMARGAPDGLTVIRPQTLPFHRQGTPFYSWNSRRLRASVSEWFDADHDERLLYTFSPITYGLEDCAGATIYHSVDLLHEYPGTDRHAILRNESELARKGVQAVASSHGVKAHLESVGFEDVIMWENVANTTEIAARRAPGTSRRGHVVFVGNFLKEKIDTTLLSAIAADPEVVHLHLAGPLGEGGSPVSKTWWKEITSSPKVTYHGSLSTEQVAKVLVTADVGVVPYRSTPYTVGVLPLKLYEYLAAGLGVVACGLPAVQSVPGQIISTDREGVVEGIRSLLGSSEAARKQRWAVGDQQSWVGRGVAARALVRRALVRSGDRVPSAPLGDGHQGRSRYGSP